MNKIRGPLEDRKKFVKLSIDDPKAASKEIMLKAKRLSKATRVPEKIRIISEILHVTQRSIYRDCAN